MLAGKFKYKITGVTFVEMLIALIVNIIILSALLYMVAREMGNYNTIISIDTLNQQLQMSMDLMISDIRRAGFWVNAKNDIGLLQNSNPFMASGTDITATSSCILFTYDHAKNGTLPSITSASDDDRYGYRLVGGILQTRPPGATFSCAAATNSWENVTNSQLVTITALSFSIVTTSVPSSVPNMVLRGVNISITGQLVSNTSVTKTLTAHVRVRNDKYVP